MRGTKGILFAADIDEKEILLSILNEVKPFISAIKIGNFVLYKYGWSIIKAIKNQIDLPLIADLKLLDMPNMIGRITNSAVNAGADGIMVAGPIGITGITECRKYLKEKSMFIFTQFTHCDGLIDDIEANKYIELALGLDCDGIQVPATKKGRIKEVREKVDNKLIIISCGIGTQKFYDSENEGPSIGSAINEGADYEIIGRSIYSPSQNNLTIKEAAKIAWETINQYIG